MMPKIQGIQCWGIQFQGARWASAGLRAALAVVQAGASLKNQEERMANVELAMVKTYG